MRESVLPDNRVSICRDKVAVLLFEYEEMGKTAEV